MKPQIPGIPQESAQLLLGVFEAHSRVRHVVLYGSRAKGTMMPGSDIDLCIKDSALDLQDVLDLEGAVDDLLLPWKVDLSVYETIENLELKSHIDRAGISVYLRPIE